MFTIIIPVYNEAEVLERTVEALKSFIKKNMNEKFFIIISEDGSTDDTDRIARMLEKKYNNVLHIYSKQRLGKGLALKRCMNYIKGDVVFYMDADLSTNLESLLLGLEELRNGVESADAVIGSRYHPESRVKREFFRDIESRMYILAVKLLFGTKLSDMQCGFKGFKTVMFKHVNGFVQNNNRFWDTEFLIRAIDMKYVIKELPVEWDEREHLKFCRFKDNFGMIKELLKLKLERLKK
jgi:glycosyltransferase involved in cell wall biosynthesis